MAKGDSFLYRYPDIFGLSFSTDDEGDEMIATLPSDVKRRLDACRAHSKASDRSIMELVEDALCFWSSGDHLIKEAPCELTTISDHPGDPAWATGYADPDCGGNGDERPFLVPPQGTCPNHYWSDEDLALSELIAEELPTLIAATLYNRYRLRRG